MNEKNGAGPGRPRQRRRAAVRAAVLAGTALLAVACSGGGSGQPGAGSGPAGLTVQKMDSFAGCMRGHGVPDFYFSHQAGTPSPDGGVVLSFGGYQVTGVNPQSAQFQQAMKSCRHMLGIHPPSQAVQHEQFVQMLKAAACMRSHGYPGWPDPSTGPNGQGIMVPGPPAGVDINSPQLQAAAKACGEGLP